MNPSLTQTFKAALALVLFMLAQQVKTTFAQGPPVEVHDMFVVSDICRFPVLVEIDGKSKAITLPGDRIIATSPAVTATLTNLDNPVHHETLGITGSFHLTFLANGNADFVVTGRNLLAGFGPEAPFVISIGRFTFTIDPDGNV